MEESSSYSRYHPSKGYTWDFKDKKFSEKKEKKESTKTELSSLFQRQRVDMLLNELTRKYPPPRPPGIVQAQQPERKFIFITFKYPLQNTKSIKFLLFPFRRNQTRA